jgi:lysozyme
MAGVITPAKAEALLYLDVEWAVKAVNRYVTLALRQNQFDALVSIVFNIGETAFRKSTLVRLLNEGKLIAAAAQFDRWKYSEGKVSKVLVARRAAEKTLFQTA